MSRSRAPRLPDPPDYARAAQAYFATRYAGPKNELSGSSIAIRCTNPAAHQNGDAHPSLRVALDKGTWRCDPCGAGGGLADLVQRLEGLPSEVEAHRVIREVLGESSGAGSSSGAGDAANSRGRGRPTFAAQLRELVTRDRAHLEAPARVEDLAWLASAWRVTREILDRYVVGITPAVLAPQGPAGPRTFELSCPSVDSAREICAIKLYRPRWKELGGDPAFKAIAVKGSKPGLFGGHLLAPGAAEGRSVVVVGGEKDALVAAAALAGVATLTAAPIVVANARGEGGWRGDPGLACARTIAAAAPARVVVALDANEATRGVPVAVAALRAAGITPAAVLVLAYPPAFLARHPKGGVAQLVLEVVVDEDGGAEGLARAIAAASPAPAPAAGPAPVSAPEDRPQIVAGPDIHPAVDAAEEALLARPDLDLYQRSGQLVRVVRTPAGPSIAPAPVDHLTELLSRASRWIRHVPQPDGSLREIPIQPPGWVAKTYTARSSWRLRDLAGIVETPTIRRDGTLLETHGYDPASGLLYEPARDPQDRSVALIFPRVLGEVPPGSPPGADPVASTVDYDAARVAAGVLQDLLADFPFVADHDRSAALAALITPLVRSAIPGPCPLFGVTATTPGSGKSLLVDVAAILATGREARRMTQRGDPDEDAKTILSLGLEGPRLVLIDNVERPLGSDALNAVLTGATFSGRILGQSKTAAPPCDMVWYATGNNLELRGDMARRVVPIELDPRCERPETRGGFRHPRLLAHARQHRGELVVAAVRMVLAYLHAGRPPQDLAPYGSFDGWSDVVRSTLVWLGYEDPCAGCERLRANADPALDAWGTFLETWVRSLGPQEVTVAELLDHARRVEPLRQALAATDARLDPDRLDPRRVGYALRKWKGRIVSGYRLEHRGEEGHAKVRVWSVTVLAK